MQYEEALLKLEPLPALLPDGPASLMPLLHDRGGPRPTPGTEAATTNGRSAAVLVLLYPDARRSLRVVLTERADRVGQHSGEVSFPGGRAEPGDGDPATTALREAAEEVGLDPSECGLRVVGLLPALWVPVSSHVVTPVVAVAARRPTLHAEPAEVAAILHVPAERFLPGAPLVAREREVRGLRLTYDAFPLDGLAGATPGLVVWGMTARILGSLGAWLGRPGT